MNEKETSSMIQLGKWSLKKITMLDDAKKSKIGNNATQKINKETNKVQFIQLLREKVDRKCMDLIERLVRQKFTKEIKKNY